MWDLRNDEEMMKAEAFLQVARCTKIINAGRDDAKYMVNVRQYAKYVVKLAEKVSPTDIEEGMRVGVTPAKYEIKLPLPPRIDPTVSMMQVEDKPDVTYDDVGGAGDALEKLREVVEMPLLHPERFVSLGIDPPKVRSGARARAQRRSRRCTPPTPLTHTHARARPPPPLPTFFAGRAAVRPAGHGQDAVCARRGQPHRRVLHPRHWQRAHSKVRGGGRAHGARAVSDCAHQEGVHCLL